MTSKYYLKKNRRENIYEEIDSQRFTKWSGIMNLKERENALAAD